MDWLHSYNFAAKNASLKWTYSSQHSHHIPPLPAPSVRNLIPHLVSVLKIIRHSPTDFRGHQRIIKCTRRSLHDFTAPIRRRNNVRDIHPYATRALVGGMRCRQLFSPKYALLFSELTEQCKRWYPKTHQNSQYSFSGPPFETTLQIERKAYTFA